MAIVWVLAHQLIVVPAGSTWERVLLWPAHFGWVGVTLFFALSGFLITGVLLDTRDAPNRGRSFYARRALRILPLYLLLVTAVFAVSALAGGALRVARLSWTETAAFWLLLGNWAQAADGSFLVGPLAVTWSVAIEEQFYLAWPWLAWSLPPRRLGWLCVAACVGCCVARVAAQAAGVNEIALYASTWARLDALAIGSAAAVAVRSGFVPAERRGQLWGVLIVSGAIASIGDLIGYLASDDGRYFCPAFSLGPGITCGAIAAGALVLLLADEAAAPRLTRWFESAWLRSWGLISYGVYLTHGPLRALVRDYVYGPGWERAGPLVRFPELGGSLLPALAAYILLCVPLCWAAGWLSYRLIERPFLRLKPAFSTNPGSE